MYSHRDLVTLATDPSDESVPIDGDDGGEDLEYEVDDDEVSEDERTWAILAHAAGFVGLAIPVGNILGPLLVWAIKKDEGQFVDENGKQAINFQITWTLLLFVTGLSVFVGFVLFPLAGLVWLALTAIAVIRTSDDQVYDYPLTVDFVS